MKTRKSLLYRKQKRGGGGERGGVRLLPGIVAGGTVLIVLLSALSWLMIRCVLPVSLAPLLGKLSLGLSSGIGCWTAARSSGARKLLAAAGAGIFLLAATAACFALQKDPGPMRLAAPAAVTIGTILIGALLGARWRGHGYT